RAAGGERPRRAPARSAGDGLLDPGGAVRLRRRLRVAGAPGPGGPQRVRGPAPRSRAGHPRVGAAGRPQRAQRPGRGGRRRGGGFEWQARRVQADRSAFEVRHRGRALGTVEWALLGDHNVRNGLAAIAACAAAGVDVAPVLPALARFRGVKRRMELLGQARGITVYDDFAHHPTAIATTLAGLRAKVGAARIVVAMEPRSNSMRLGAHADALAPSLDDAD